MTTDRKILWASVAGVAVLALLVLLSGRVGQALAPEPVAAWLAIQPAGAATAVDRPVEIEAGTPFTLHAVLEAETWDGKRVFFTDAERLTLGGEEIAAELLRPWSGSAEVRVLWFVVEGTPAHLEVAAPADLERFQFREVLRAEWPRAWSVPGVVEPSAESRRPVAGGGDLPAVGTQRYHVRIELFGPESRIKPRHRLTSPPAYELPAAAATFPTVTSRLPGLLGPPTSVFGLTQISLLDPSLGAERARLADWSRQRIAFSGVTVVREMLAAAGVAYDDLLWEDVDLDAGPAWGESAASAGDLLRVGERFVVLLADRGAAGRLDGGDLCIDFFKVASMRPLDQVFVGEGLVEWARLAAAAPPAGEA